MTASVIASASAAFTTITDPATGTISSYTPVAGDVVVVFVNTGAVQSVVDPSGWVNLLGANVSVANAASSASCYFHIVTAGEATAGTVAWTLTGLFSTARTGRVTTVVVRGAQASPKDAATSTQGNSTATHATAAITPALGDNLVLAFVGGNNTSAATYTAPGGVWSVVRQDTASRSVIVLQNAPSVAGQAIASQNVTISASTQYCGISVAIASVPSDGGRFFAFF